ncbi:MAG: phosphotransferase [Gammaproteobacteria bacterium]
MFRIRAGETDAILKLYYQVTNSSHNRLEAEYGFLDLLSEDPSLPVPKPIARNSQLNVGIYTALPGVACDSVSANDIDLCLEFVKNINELRESPKARAIADAADACWSLDSHIDLVAGRVARLQRGVSATSEENLRLLEFVENSLLPKLSEVTGGLNELRPTIQQHGGMIDSHRILSPSDFGFHNVLRSESDIFFVDFEYAGWDDPVKLLCDFACQPDVIVAQPQVERFWSGMADWLGGEHLFQYAQGLLRLYRIKWICIMLNEFLQEGIRRREHANVSAPDVRIRQLEKAARYYNSNLAEK